MGYRKPVQNLPIPIRPGVPYAHEQWETLLAIADTIIPSIDISRAENTSSRLIILPENAAQLCDDVKGIVSEYPGPEILKEYLQENASIVSSGLLSLVFRDYLPEDSRNKIGILLTLLCSRFGCLLATGSSTLFRKQPLDTREAIIHSWKTSRIPQLRDASFSLSFLLINIWIKSSMKLYPAIGFPGVPKTKHVNMGTGYPFKFMQLSSTVSELETDVLVVGSGCGGAVAAAKIAQAGYRVMVVDKGYYHKPDQFPMSERDSSIHMFENGQFVPSDDGSISAAAGSTWGGGGTVNWSASLQLQAYIRKEWASQGLPFFESVKFQECLDHVCNRMGVSTDHILHNHGNLILLEGARLMGYRATAVPQNTGGNRHFDGFCSQGCASAEKQGPTNCWLPDAAKHGAKFIEGLHVDRILFEEKRGRKVAYGVEGKWISRDKKGTFDGKRCQCTVRIRVKKRVILSAGTLWSPILLLRSGLKNPNIGQNFHAHPAVFTSGIFKKQINPWEGGILTSVCTEFENLDGKGHGVKIEPTCMTPSMSLSFYPWTSGAAMKWHFLKFRHMNHYIIISRDRDAGQIYPDPISGRPRVRYSPSAFDRSNLLAGQLAMAKMLFVAGADEIHVMTDGVPPFKRRDCINLGETPRSAQGAVSDAGASSVIDSVERKEFKAWLSAVRKKGVAAPYTAFGNAHQMGTCRMGASADSSVVDTEGHVWGVENLLVCDASVFPNASGVNPMVTVMAIADWIAERAVQEIKAQGVKSSSPML